MLVDLLIKTSKSFGKLVEENQKIWVLVAKTSWPMFRVFSKNIKLPKQNQIDRKKFYIWGKTF